MKQSKQQDAICSPLALFVALLFLAQLVIFNVGIGYVGNADDGLDVKSLNGFTEGSKKRIVKSREPDPLADGTFNGYSMYFRQKANPWTRAHCVGEDYQEGKSWRRKSCKFDFLCFDTSIKEYVVFLSPSEDRVYELAKNHPFVDLGQAYLKSSHNQSNTVSLGGINLKWGWNDEGGNRLEWFPQIRKLSEGDSLAFYELPSNVVMVPFHSMNGANPGHLIWDDFLPIYTLLTMYQLDPSDVELLMMRYVLKDGRGLWASCDFKDDKRELCEKMHRKFLPLMMGSDPLHDLTTTENFDMQIKGEAKSNLVCAKTGVAGFGALTDHGPSKLHGWEDPDYKVTQNHGRGGLLYDFRNFMMSNIGVPLEHNHLPPFRIIFSEKSSENLSRNLSFDRQKQVLRRSFNPQYISIESYAFKDIPLEEQVELAGQTTIYISGVGGGAVTAMFLPRGASVLLYFMATAGTEGGRPSGKPARLDWDLFNNLGYLKVHWLPTESMHQEADLRSLVLLVQHELDALMRERSYEKLFY